MSKKTMLLVASWIELMLAAYCLLAFLAWSARRFLEPVHRDSSEWLLAVPVVLAAACFLLYPSTRRKAGGRD